MASIRSDISTGTRVYVQTRYGEPVVDRLKSLGAHWDRDAKCWWVGTAKRALVEALLVESDRKVEASEEPAERKQTPDDIRLTGKGKYKGRTYYLGAYRQDRARVRCLTLPDAEGKFLDFWADATQVQVTKTYQPRQAWDGRRYSNRTVTVYTTLGSIADFIRRQRDPATRRVECVECGSWYDEGDRCRDCGGC